MNKFLLTLSAVAVSAFSVAAEENVLAEADFSTLTNGTEEAPVLCTSYPYGPSAFKDWVGTSTGKIGEAGTSGIYIPDGSTLSSPRFSGVTTTGGAIKVTMTVKLNNTNIGGVSLAWGYGTAQTVYLSSGEWQDIEYIVTPTSASSYSNQAKISPFLVADGIFVKYIKIAQSPDFVSAPTVYQPSDADGTSFTARWRTVTGALKYYIDVYSYDAAGNKAFFKENMEVVGTSVKIEGLDPATTYYYVVRAANATGVSSDSEEIEVVKVITEIATPVAKLMSCDESGNFTASWSEVADADSYSVAVFRSTVLAEAAEATVLSEDFSAMTTGSLSSVDFIGESKLALLSEPGWTGSDLLSAGGAIGISPFSGDAYIATPALDLSADGGKATVVINMAGNRYGTFYTGYVVKFSTVDANGNESVPVEVTIDKKEFADYTVALTGCTDATKVKVAVSGDDRVIIDNIDIKQLKPAGYVSTITYATAETEACEYSGKVEFEAGVSYTFAVAANGRTVDGGEITEISSSPSEPLAITPSSGIGSVDAADSTVIAKAGEGTVAITTPAAATVEIADIAGRVLVRSAVAEGTSSIAVPARGVVIVKVGAKTAKMIF